MWAVPGGSLSSLGSPWQPGCEAVSVERRDFGFLLVGCGCVTLSTLFRFEGISLTLDNDCDLGLSWRHSQALPDSAGPGRSPGELTPWARLKARGIRVHPLALACPHLSAPDSENLARSAAVLVLLRPPVLSPSRCANQSLL